MSRTNVKNLALNSLSASILTIHLIVLASAYAQLIYAHSLESFLPVGLMSIFIGTIIYLIGTTYSCSLNTAIGRIQDEQMPIMVLMTLSIASMVPSVSSLFATTLIAIALSTILTGIFFLLISYFKLGNIIRFIPYPVVAGFLAGVGWLLVTVSLKQVIHLNDLSLSSLPILFSLPIIYTWLPALVFAFIILFATEYFQHRLTLPILIILGLGLFYVVCLIFNISMTSLRDYGFLLPKGSHAEVASLVNLFSLSSIDWNAIAKNVSYLVTIIIINIFSFLFTANGIENSMECDLDLDHELNRSGYQNIVAGFIASPAGFFSMSHTILNDKLKSKDRSVGYLCALLFIALILFGENIISFLPQPLLTAMVVFLGLALLKAWGISVRAKLSFLEYLVVLCILFAVIFLGLFEGVVIGVAFSIILFVFNYSAVNIIKFTLTGRELRSSRQYGFKAQQLLDKHGSKLIYFKLQEFLFFGSANYIFEQVRKKFGMPKKGISRFVIFDFKFVSGIDASFISVLKKIDNYAQKNNFNCILTELNHGHLKRLKKSFLSSASNRLLIIKDNDHALEHYENYILKSYKYNHSNDVIPYQIAPIASDFFQYLETVQLNKGEILFRQNDTSDNLFYLISGELAVYLELNLNERKRISLISSGNIVGEVGFYLKSPRTATIIANEDCVLKRLTAESLALMEKDNPALITQYHYITVKILCERLTRTNRQITLLLK